MTAFCQPLPDRVVGEMLQDAARALCDRAGEPAQQRESRALQMMLSTMALAPRDGFEVMLATLAFGHGQMILDSMNDVFHAEAETLKAKTKTTIVPLGRAMLAMLKELRLLQQRPLVGSVTDTKQDAAAVTQPPQSDAPEVSDEPWPDPATVSEAELATLVDPRLALPQEAVAWLAGAEPSVVESAPESGPADPMGQVPVETRAAPAQKRPWLTPVNVFAVGQPSLPPGDDADRPAWEDDTKSAEEQIVSFHETLAAGYETVARQRAGFAANGKAASGD